MPSDSGLCYPSPRRDPDVKENLHGVQVKQEIEWKDKINWIHYVTFFVLDLWPLPLDGGSGCGGDATVRQRAEPVESAADRVVRRAGADQPTTDQTVELPKIRCSAQKGKQILLLQKQRTSKPKVKNPNPRFLVLSSVIPFLSPSLVFWFGIMIRIRIKMSFQSLNALFACQWAV